MILDFTGIYDFIFNTHLKKRNKHLVTCKNEIIIIKLIFFLIGKVDMVIPIKD